VVKHQDISRTLDVTADVSGRDLAAVQDEVNSRVRAMSFPMEYRAEVAPGSNDSAQPNRATLAYMFAALLAILLIFQAATASWRLGAVTLLTLPLAVVGGLVTGALVGISGSLGAILGLLAVLGLAIRSNLSFVRRLQDLRAQDIPDSDGDVGGDRGLVVQASREQAKPVLLTALTTAAAFLPFAVLGSVAGLELLQPMAVIALGGLVTSTALTLLLLPAICLWVGPGRRRSVASRTIEPAPAAGGQA
jgi:Cu/Ag efflux pump CusA